MIGWTILGAPFRAGAQGPNIRELERERREANAETLAALDITPDPTRPVPQSLISTLHQLERRHLAVEGQIQHLLSEKSIRAEQGIRTAAGTATLISAILLRRAELRCAELAYVDDSEEMRARDTMAWANGDLDIAGETCKRVVDEYLRKLQGRPIRRERFARRLIWLITFHLGGSFDRDSGVNDIRQQLRGHVSEIREIRDGLKIFGSRFMSSILHKAAVDYAEENDPALLTRVVAIVKEFMRHNLQPTDANFAVLIARIWAIRGRFEQLPTWSESMRWRAFCSALLAWLYLFAAVAAEAKGLDAQAAQHRRRADDEFKIATILRRRAFESHQRATSETAENALLDRGLRPLLELFGNFGRQKYVPGFPAPPSSSDLLTLTDALLGQFERRRN